MHVNTVSRSRYWSAATLEAYLYSNRRDLLFAFFGISLAGESRSHETTIKRNIAMKRRIAKEFIDPEVKYYEVLETPWARLPPNEC